MKNSIIILLFLIATSSFSQTINDLKKQLNNLSKDATLKNASISFYAFDLDSNRVIAYLNANKALVPASTLKLVTTATALELFGQSKHFSTSVQYTGYIDSNKVLHGNIYIKGGGDPSLGAHRFQTHYGNFINEWANKIIALGIDSITGQIIGDASIFSGAIPSTWIWADLGNYYGAGPSGLSIYENSCHIDLESGKEIGDSTFIRCIVPYIPNLAFKNYVKSILIKNDQSYIYGGPYQENRTIKGGIPLNKKRFSIKGSIPDPAYLTAFELDMELRGLGVRVANPSTTLRKLQDNRNYITSEQKTTITTTSSPSLISLIEQTNKYSINLYAEHLINHIAIHTFKKEGEGKGATAISNFWKKNGIDVNGMYINDGSGLSRFNAITSKQLVEILSLMYRSEYNEQFLNSLPIAGKSGTLRNVGKGTAMEGKIKAKSGYMTRVRGYSGYVTTKKNTNIAFALIVNNYNCTAYQMRKKMEKIMIKLAEIEE